MTDPFEEFEMRPITEGLGFHKKALKTKKEIRKPSIAADALGNETPVVPPDALLKKDSRPNGPIFHDSLPREGWQPLDSELKLDFLESEVNYTPEAPSKPSYPKHEINIEKSPMLTPESFLESTLASSLASTLTRRGSADSPPLKSLKESSVAFSALVVDGLLVTALSMIFLVCLLIVTKINLEFVIAQLGSDVWLQLSVYSLIGFIGLTYFTISRVFCGQSLGEWAFEYQVGNDDEQKDQQFPMKVMMRSVLTLATGIVILPIASLLFGKDLMAKITGVQLYQKQQ